jgi:hypothetical protein
MPQGGRTQGTHTSHTPALKNITTHTLAHLTHRYKLTARRRRHVHSLVQFQERSVSFVRDKGVEGTMAKKGGGEREGECVHALINLYARTCTRCQKINMFTLRVATR